MSDELTFTSLVFLPNSRPRPHPPVSPRSLGRHLMTRAEAWADQGRWRRYGSEFLWFGLKQGWACLFGGAMLGLLVGTHRLWSVVWPEDRAAYRVG